MSIIPLSAAHITNAGGDITNVENTRNENIAIAYNNGTIFLSTDVDAIAVYSINGALVMQQEGRMNSVSVNLAKGIYIVRAMTNGEIATCKISVK